MTEIKIEEKKTTKANGFILPMLGFGRAYYGPGLINCYFGDGERPELKGHIFLLFKFTNDPQFAWLDRQMESHANFVERYDVDKGEQIMFVFSVPEQYKEDYERFKKGKFSTISPKLKQETLRLNDLGPESNIFAAFTKGKRLKKHWAEKLGVDESAIDEVLGPPDPREEVFRYKPKSGYPKYEGEQRDSVWEVVFKEDENSRLVVCKIPAYYKKPEKIAEHIAAALKNKKLDLTL